MKLKAKSPKAKLGLPTIVLLCFLCFIGGLFTSTVISQVSVPQFLSGPRSSSRVLESEDEDHGPMLPGDTGDSFIASIPFQVCNLITSQSHRVLIWFANSISVDRRF